MKAPNPAKNGSARPSPLRMLRWASSDGGTSGTRPLRSMRNSTAANAARASGATASSAIVQAGQRSAGPSVSGMSRARTVTPSRTVPWWSTRAAWPDRLSGTCRRARIRPATPIGTLTRKIGRQPVPSMLADTSRPPSSWPTTAARPPVAPYRARARARRWPWVAAWMVDRTCGTISAADAPWAARAATRTSAVGARPQASDVRVNAAIPARNSRRRPNASPSRPPTTSSSAYAEA